MKTKSFLFSKVILWAFMLLPLAAWGQTSLNMPQFGKQTVSVSDEEITFYDFKGTGAITSTSSNSSCATMVFTPADASKAIQITFESVDVHSDGSSYPGYLNIYNGTFDADGTFSYPTSSYGVSSDGSYFPSNESLIAKLDGTYSNLSYISSAADGSMSVCFHWKYAKKSDGWVAKVRAIKLTDMEIKGASSDYSDVPASIYAGKKNVTLGSVSIATEGYKNADRATAIKFALAKNGGVVNPADLKLFKDGKPIDATISEANGIYSMAFDDELASGNNKYSIVGDILASAPFDAELRLAVQSICTKTQPDGVTPFTAGAPATLIVPHMALISSTPTTITVGDDNIAFYDDGGPEGNISQDFKGQITFKPATKGKKVMIDFSMIDLFNTSSIGKNDILNIYYGSTADSKNLAATLLKEAKATIRSIADDGALTVTLTSSTGTGFKKGFEATVSQFTPQAMALDTVEVAKSTIEKAAAGDENCAILSVNVVTTNTEPALTTKSFKFTTAGTFANISKAAIFSTGTNASFSDAKKIGEVDVTADEFTVGATEAVTLHEGNNYFWLAYTIEPKAVTGAKITAKASSVELSDGNHAVPSETVGECEVENIAYSAIGNAEKTVYGSWIFKNTPQSSYNTGYASTAGDQVVTFRPGNEGMIVEMEFSKFKIAYPYYSSSTNPYFRIYSGSTASADNLLWECTKEVKATGPEAVLRSKAADGSMTVVFNANGVSSEYNGGWEAAVREYKSVPMSLDTVTVKQASTAIISTSATATNLDIIGFDVVTKGDKNPVSLTDISLNLKGCQDKVENVVLYALGTSEAKGDTLAVATPVAGKADLKMSLTKAFSLSEGSNNFLICYDLKSGLKAGLSIDAALNSVTVGGKEVAVVAGDPDGERVTKNIYLLESGKGHEVKINEGESLMFYDNGGADGKVDKGFKGTVTFVPASADKAIKLTVKNWQLGANDKFKISFGGEAKTTPDLTWSNKVAVGDEAISFAADGKLTVDFSSGTYYQGDGWEIEVSNYEVQPLSLDTVTATPIAQANVLPGSANNKLIRIDVKVNGDKGKFNIDKFSFNTAGSTALTNISNFRIFATDTVSTFIATKQYGADTPCGKTFEIAGNYTAELPGIYHFWLVGDIATNAFADDEIVVSAVSATTQGNTVSDLSAATAAKSSVAEGLHGTFTIGASDNADYHTFAAAVDALKNGVDGPVTFEIEKGTYKETILLEGIPGTSANNTITFRSKSGDYNDVVIEHDVYHEPAYSDDKSYYEYGVFTVSHTPYVTLEGVTVKTSDTSYPSVIRLRGGSSNFTLRNSYITAPETESYSSDINLLYLYVGSKSVGNVNHNMLVENNIFEGGYTAITTGAQWLTVENEQGTRIIGNTFKDSGSKALYVYLSDGIVIDGNHFINNVTAKSDFSAIDIKASGACRIVNNDINYATKNYVTAISVRDITATAEAPALIANNEVKIACAGTSASYGIKLGSLSSNMNIAYNTFRLTGDNALSAPFFSFNEQSAIRVINNIFQNDAKGYVYRANKASYLNGLTFEKNAIYTAGQNFAYVASNLASFADWKELSNEADAVIGQISFISNDVLMPADASTIMCATPLSYVTTDIFGVTRSEKTPTIGACEYAPVPAPAFAEGYPKVSAITEKSASVIVKMNTSGMAQILVRKAAEAAPSADEVMASENVIDVRQGQECAIKVDNLVRNTEYKVYAVLYNLNTENSAVIAGATFTTSFTPTAVSTFENVTAASGDFEDGTAMFSGFAVESATEVPQDGSKVAKLTAATGIVTPTNITNGIALDGFFIKAAEAVTMKVYNESNVAADFTIEPTAWRYVNLRDKKLITKIEFASTGAMYIDNFSGKPNTLDVALSDVKANEGADVTLAPVVKTSTGVAPYTYSWTDYSGKNVGNGATLAVKANQLTAYSVNVTDAWGNTCSKNAVLTVLGSAKTATFEEMPLAAESHWLGNDPEDKNTGLLTDWYSGSYRFSAMKHMDTWWNGYACTNETATSYKSLNDQFRSAAGGAYAGNNYAVSYPEDLKIYVTNSEDGDSIRGFYITNTPYATDVILNGDSYGSKAFSKGDFFKLTIIGYNGETATKSIDYYLADYRADKAADHYCLDTWQWLDLRALGKVTSVGFSFNGSQNNSWGLLTPKYFALDDFNGNRVITEKEELKCPLDTKSYDLAKYFTFDDAEATIVYALETVTANPDVVLSISDDKLVVEGKKDLAKAAVIISATQKGKTQFVKLPVAIDKHVSVGDVAVENDVRIFPNPVTERINIATSLSDYTVEIFSTNGSRIFMQDSNSGNISIERGSIEAGIYMLRISNAETSIVKRIIIK